MNRDREITNADLLLFALYKLGGAGRYVDVEDVFMEMWRLAPARFSWRKYRQPNYKITSKALVDIRQRGDNDLILGTGDYRQLSARGVEWVTERLDEFERVAAGIESAPPDRRPSQRVVAELSKSRLVRDFIDKGRAELDRTDLAQLLRCAPDASRRVWRERLETLKSAAKDGGREDLVRFFEYTDAEHPDWFGEESNERSS